MANIEHHRSGAFIQPSPSARSQQLSQDVQTASRLGDNDIVHPRLFLANLATLLSSKSKLSDHYAFFQYKKHHLRRCFRNFYLKGSATRKSIWDSFHQTPRETLVGSIVGRGLSPGEQPPWPYTVLSVDAPRQPHYKTGNSKDELIDNLPRETCQNNPSTQDCCLL